MDSRDPTREPRTPKGNAPHAQAPRRRVVVDVPAIAVGLTVGIGTILALAGYSFHAAVTPELESAPLAAGWILGLGVAAALVSCSATMFVRYRQRAHLRRETRTS